MQKGKFITPDEYLERFEHDWNMYVHGYASTISDETDKLAKRLFDFVKEKTETPEYKIWSEKQ